MKTYSVIASFLLLLIGCGLATAVHAAERATIQGILISASNDKGETDRRLAPYEPTLRRILRFESYRFRGDDRAALAVPGQGHLALGDEHQVEVETESADGKGIRIKVRWTQGGRTLMNTGLVLRPGVPAVLGGPSTGNKSEVYAVILIGQ